LFSRPAAHNNINKKQFMIILFLVLVIIIGGTFALSRPKQKSIPPVPPTPLVSQPILPSSITTEQPLYQVDPVNTTFPRELPIYAVSSRAQMKTIGSSFASSVGLNTQPQTIQPASGLIYVWSNDKQSVTASEGLSTITYNSGVNISGPLNSPLETYYESATRAVSSLHLSNQITQLSQTVPQYFNPSNGEANEVNSISQATSVQLNYQYTINGIPVFVGTSVFPSLSARLNAKGELLSFTIYVLPAFVTKGNTVSLVTYDEAAQNLANGKGRLTDLTSGDFGNQPYYFDSPPQISSVQDVQLGYYYNSQQNQLIPVYAFKGVGKINNNTVNTTTLVSAVK